MIDNEFTCKISEDSFVRYIISTKNVKGTFLSSESLPDDISKILFYGNQISHGTSLCVEIRNRRLNCLGKEESQRNHTVLPLRVQP